MNDRKARIEIAKCFIPGGWAAELSYALVGQRRRTSAAFVGDTPALALECLVYYLNHGGQELMDAGERIDIEAVVAHQHAEVR